MRPLATDLDDSDARPYFLWDEDLTVSALRAILAEPSHPRWVELTAKTLREARDDQVWRFLAPPVVAARFDEIAPRLGRRRAFWSYLFESWRRHGLL